MIFDTRGHSASAWDESLMPVGFGTAQKEPFESWKKRNNRTLAHLHPAISDLLIEAAREVHSGATRLQRAGEFPAPLEHEFRIRGRLFAEMESGYHEESLC